MDVLVLQHIACEPPGVFEDVLVERGATIHRVELDEGEPLPADASRFAAVVAMGGPMSVNDDAQHPWLRAERELIAAHVRAGGPFWGSCLGVQLLAAALGGRVYAGDAPEVGVLTVEPTAPGLADPVLGPLSWPVPTLQWHGDTFDLPPDAVPLAWSPAYANQAFRVGRVAYGVQFHIEVTAEMAEEWATIPAYAAYADQVLGSGGGAAILADFHAHAERMQAEARALFGRWIDLWAGPRA